MFSWSNIPLVRLVIPFAIGILLSNFLIKDQDPISLTVLIAILLVVCCTVTLKQLRYKERWIYGFTIYLTFIGLGVLHQTIWQKSNTLKIKNQEAVEWIGRVEEVNYRGDTASLLKVKVHAVDNNGSFNEKLFGLTAYLKSPTKLKVGDWISAKSVLKPIEKPLNPYQFNYANFMYKRGYLRSTYLDKVQQHGRQVNLEAYTSSLRASLISGFEKAGIKDKELAVLNAISLGDKSLLNQETRNAYAGAGAMHILAVSGLHVGIVYLLFSQLLFFLSSSVWERWIKAAILLFVIWGFAFLTGLSPSVQRAGCMFSFIIIAGALNRYSSTLNSIAAAAFILLLINPMILFELGFQLSFAAVIGIVSMHPSIYAIWQPSYILIDKAWSLIVVSITAQLATLPFVLYYFHQFPNWFLITNLFVIPLAFIIVAGAILVGCLILFFQEDFLLAKVLDVFLKLLNGGIQAMENLPFFTTSDIWIAPIQAILLGVMVLAIMLFINHRKFFQLFTALACLAIFFTINAATLQLKRASSYIGVYAFKNSPSYLFKKGQSALVLMHPEISDYQKQILQDHLHAERVQEIKYIHKVEDLFDLQLFEAKNIDGNLLIEHEQQLYYFHFKQDQPLKKLIEEVDYIIVEQRIALERLLEKEIQAQLIAASSIPIWWVQKQQHQNFHAVIQEAYWQSK